MIYRTEKFILDTADQSVRTPDGIPVNLYHKEYALLRFLCERRGVSASQAEIVDAVWDRNFEYSSNVVAVSVSNIRKRLGKDAIRTVRHDYLVEVLAVESRKPIPESVSADTDGSPAGRRWTRSSKDFFLLAGSVFLSALILSGTTFFWGGGAKVSGQIVVSGLDVDPEGNDNDRLDQESVTFRNVSDADVDITGWSVTDDMGHRYVFSKRILKAGDYVRLVTGPCRDDEGNACWNFTGGYAVWNNDADTVRLRNTKGELVAARHYEIHKPEGPSASR